MHRTCSTGNGWHPTFVMAPKSVDAKFFVGNHDMFRKGRAFSEKFEVGRHPGKVRPVYVDIELAEQNVAELKAKKKCPGDVQHRQVKYLNNIVEADHGKLKQLIQPVCGFKTMKSAYATIKGFEVMHALRKGQSRS